MINERTGLLNDLAMVVGHGGGVPSGQVNDATATIAKQVFRSNTIMLNLNRFSHSGDTPVHCLSDFVCLNLEQVSVRLRNGRL